MSNINFPTNPINNQEYTFQGKTWIFNGKGWEAKSTTLEPDYENLTNKPSINSVTLKGNKTAAQLSLATAAQGAKADTALQSLPPGTVIDPDYNQFTDAEKNKLQGLENYDDTQIIEVLENKVDKIVNHSLVANTEIQKLAQYPLFQDLELTSEHKDLVDKNGEAEFQHITSREKDLLSNSLTGVVYLPSLPIQGGMSKLIYHNNEIYLAARNNTSKMYKYNLVDRNWIELADSPATLQTSGGTCFDGSRYIYTLRGGSTISNNFYRYDIVTNTWTTLGATQFTVSNITIGTGNGSQTVFGLWGGKSFPTSSDSSVAGVSVFVNGVSTPATINANTLTATFNTAPHSGAIITASFTLRQPMGSSGAMTIFNNEIYVVFGDDTPVFGKYNISLNQWTVLRDTPSYCDWSGMLDKVVSINGSSYIYVLRGENELTADTPDFWRYNINLNSWEVMTSIPLATDSPDLMLCGDYILALRGVNSLHQFLYSIKNNSWIQIANSPFQTLRGSVVLYNEYSIGTSSKFDYIINDGIQGFMQINRIIVN